MMQLRDLAAARLAMLAEAHQDINSGALYRFSRLTDVGWEQYAKLLLEALEHHDESWLADQINRRGLLIEKEMKVRNGKSYYAKVPHNAATTLAEGEFNRFYIRGVCCNAIADDVETLVVYRAKVVAEPRPESERRIGQEINAAALLDDLRKHPEIDRALGVPAGPNSGLSVYRA